MRCSEASIQKLRRISRYFFQNTASCVVAKLMRISVLGCALRMKQRAWRQQVTLIEHALRQRIGVHAGIDPAEQAGRLGRE
jgi:hypothetical protein